MNKIVAIILLLFTFLSVSAQQSVSLDFFEMKNYNKVVITYYDIKDKTSSSPSNSLHLDSLENISEKTISKDVLKKIREYTLTNREIKKLFRKLKKTLIPIHSMDLHYSIAINFYADNVIIQEIKISQLTNNLVVKTEHCKNIIIDGSEIDPCLYLGQTTPQFKNYINRLLKKTSTLSQ